jgi:hypothetical protein
MKKILIRSITKLCILSIQLILVLSPLFTLLASPNQIIADYDPSWGVLAINYDQSSYKTGEDVRFSFSVLDQNGMMICDAKLVLEITSASRTTQMLRTDDGSIVVNPECLRKDITTKPDYEGKFIPKETGVYQVKLIADTRVGTKVLEDRFIVKNSTPQFVVKHDAPTRIFPKKNYPVTTKVQSNKDFKGMIEIDVPNNFDVINPTNTVPFSQEFFSGREKTLRWYVDLKKNQSIDLTFEFDAPDHSPDFYEFSKVRLKNDLGKIVFEETRNWQIGSDATFTMMTGYYIGTGVDSRAITGLGFSPDLVIIKDSSTNGADGILWKSTSMSSEVTAKMGDAEADIATDVIQSLDSDGFTLGTYADVNGAGVYFSYMAFDGSDCTSSGTFCVGSYSGNGSTPRSLTVTGFQPNLVVIKRSGATTGVFMTSDMGANTTQLWSAANQDTGGTMIRSLDATGFTIGNAANVNTNANTYWFFAFKDASGAFDTGSFTGTGSSNARTGLGFQPDAVFAKNSSAAVAATPYYNIREHSGDISFPSTDLAVIVGAITSLDSDGFTVGTQAAVNENTKTIYWFAFGGAADPVATGTYTMAVGSYTGNGTSQSVTGLAFRPDMVLIKHSDQATDQYAVFTTSQMNPDSTAYLRNAVANFTTGITSINSDGFSVGAHATVNTSSDTYHWQAFGNAWRPDTRTGAANFAIGGYMGNIVDSRDINLVPFQPDLVAIKQTGTNSGIYRTSAQSGDLSFRFDNVVETANYVQAINADGFEVGTDTRVNQSSTTAVHHFFAFKAGPNVKVGTYSGNGSTQSITAPNIQPDLLWIHATAAQEGVFKPSTLAGDNVQYYTNIANATGRVTSLDTTGFSLANNAQVNTSGSNNYRYFIWKIPTTYTQNDFEWFVTANSVTLTNVWPSAAGGADIAENTAIVQIPASSNAPPDVGDRIRIQMNLTIGGSRMGSTQQAFKLQYSAASDCTVASSWTDVGAKASGAIWRLFDEASIGDSTTQVNNISTSNSSVEGYYSEINASATNPLAVPTSNNTEWDWPVENNGAAASTTYCFRMILDDGIELNTYNADSYPKLMTAPAGSSLMRHGNFFESNSEKGFFWAN